MEDRSILAKRAPQASFRGMSAAKSGGDGYIDMARVAAAIRRQFPLLMWCLIVGLALSNVYVVLAVPRYQAIETILFDEDRAELLDEVSPVPRAVVSDTAIQGEVEIIKSQALALRVVDQLKLSDDPEFMNPPVSPVGQMKGMVKSWVRSVFDRFAPVRSSASAGKDGSDDGGSLEETPRTQAAQILRSNLEVEQIGQSFVLDIKYLGYDPIRTTRIARAFGDAYKKFQLQANYDVAREAGDWLTQRLKELEQRSLDVAQVLEKFRLDSKLVSVKGALLSEQQLSETLTKLIEAEADTAQAKARLDQFERLLSNGAGEAVATATIATNTPSDEIIAKLRIDYLETSSRYRDVKRRWGGDHPEAIRVSGRLKEIEQDLLGEMRYVTEALRAEHEIALSREESLQSNLDSITSASSEAIGLIGKLRQLEEEATIYREMYQEFLKRYEMARQQQAFPVAAIETISSATVPKGAAHPRVSASIALGLVLGGIIGAGVGAFREMREQPLRTRADLTEGLGIRLIGTIALGTAERDRPKAEQLFLRTSLALQSRVDGLSGAGGARSIGFSAVMSGSKSMLSRDFAEFLADNRARVLYIETVPGASEAFEVEGPESEGPDPRGGGSAIHRRELRSLGTFIDVLFLNLWPDRFKASGRPIELIQEIMEEISQRYDYIIVNLPPLSVNMMANNFSRNVDAVVLTLAWGQIFPSVVEEALEENLAFAERLGGAVFVDTDLHALRRYVPPGTYEAVSLGIY